MQYFVLQRTDLLKEGQQAYSIPGLVDSYMNKLPLLPATEVSIQSKKLEWLIPNNQFNQSHISQHYPTFRILKAGQEAKFNTSVKIMEGMPAPLDFEDLESPSNPGPITEPEVEFEGGLETGGIGENIAEPVESEMETGPVVIQAPKMNAREIGKLKLHRIAELKKVGVVAPKNATLPVLDELLLIEIKKIKAR